MAIYPIASPNFPTRPLPGTEKPKPKPDDGKSIFGK